MVYAFILFGPSLIAKSLGMTPETFTLSLQVLFVLPASVLFSLFVIDRFGRKPLQAWGFFVGRGAGDGLRPDAAPAAEHAHPGVRGLRPVQCRFDGPGLVSGAGILGVELAPTRIRSVAQSITVAGGRIGAAISGFGFPLLFRYIGHAGAYYVIAGIALVGAVLTSILVPETGRISLEIAQRRWRGSAGGGGERAGPSPDVGDDARADQHRATRRGA